MKGIKLKTLLGIIFVFLALLARAEDQSAVKIPSVQAGLNSAVTSSVSRHSMVEKKVQGCYVSHAFLLELIIKTDAEFSDPKKSQMRKQVIQDDFQKNPAELRECFNIIVKYSKMSGHAEDVQYVHHRLGEVSSVVDASKK